VRRVAVTGLGAVTPAGHDAPSTFASFLAGRSNVARLPRLEAERCRSVIGAEVRGFALPDARHLGRSSQLALAAAMEAVRDAGTFDPDRAGVIIGTGFGDAAETVLQARAHVRGGVRAVHPLYAPKAMANAPSACIANQFGWTGPCFTTASACAAAAHAIAMGARLIQCGDADVMLAGGTEEISCVLSSAAFDALRALSTRNDAPSQASRPFDRGRDGFVLGEGSAALVLEEMDHARRRGARVYAELVGIGMANDNHHLTAPDPTGEAAAFAMQRALTDARRDAADVRYIAAHGTSTPLNDPAETVAIHRALGHHARRVWISSVKSMIGHLLGASAAVSALAAVLAIARQAVPPTINLDEPDPACDLDYVPNVAREGRIELAMVNAFAFGGHCVSLAFAA